MAIIGNLASSKEPVSVIATTGSYTVPAGSFAILRASVSEGRSVTINGTSVMVADNLSWTTQRVINSPHGNTGYAGGPRLSVYGASGGGNNVGDLYGNSTAYNRNAIFGTYKLPSGTVIGGNGYKLIEVY